MDATLYIISLKMGDIYTYKVVNQLYGDSEAGSWNRTIDSLPFKCQCLPF